MNILRPLFVIDTENLQGEYKDRLNKEIEMLERLDFIWFIKRFVEIFNEHIRNNLYLLRGSAGSSLLLYYLGINLIDPVLHKIPLARFINELRLTVPDIDIDLPQSLRDIIMNTIVNSNNDTIRMSCNLSNENNEYFDSLIKEHPQINALHNSGVIIFQENQKELIKQNLIAENQTRFTKNDIDNLNLKKIDLLSNTALEQLDKIHQKLGSHIDYNFDDLNVFNFMAVDDGCGITYAETPLIQYVINLLKPQSINDFSMCLAIVRPFACRNITKYITCENLRDAVLYDDDFIVLVAKHMNMSEEQADQIRRTCKKGETSDFIMRVESSELNDDIKLLIKKTIPKLKSYGFCKSHSLSFARLIYMLYYCKYYYPRDFWENTIKVIKGYHNDWVYIRKGLECGLRFRGIKKCDPFQHFIYSGYWLNKEFMTKCYLKIFDSKCGSIKITIDNNHDDNDDNEQTDENCDNLIVDDVDNYYLENEKVLQKKTILSDTSTLSETINLNKECEFRGLIAGTTSTYTKYRKYQTIITIGYDNNKFIDLYLNKKRDFKKFKQVIGRGYYVNDVVPHIIIKNMKIF